MMRETSAARALTLVLVLAVVSSAFANCVCDNTKGVVSIGSGCGFSPCAGQLYVRAVISEVDINPAMQCNCNSLQCKSKVCVTNYGLGNLKSWLSFLCPQPNCFYTDDVWLTAGTNTQYYGAIAIDLPAGFSFSNVVSWTPQQCVCGQDCPAGTSYTIKYQVGVNYYKPVGHYTAYCPDQCGVPTCNLNKCLGGWGSTPLQYGGKLGCTTTVCGQCCGGRKSRKALV